jgi:uncharacterized protein (DUF433 family)
MSQHVEYRDGGYWVADSRVSLDSVVYAYQHGHTPEDIAESFPAISLAEVFGAISFYLDRRQEVDDYLAKVRAEYEAKRQVTRNADPAFYEKLATARRQGRPT